MKAVVNNKLVESINRNCHEVASTNSFPIKCFVSHRPPSREGGSVGQAKRGMNA